MITLSTGYKREDVEKSDGSIREKIIKMFETIHDKEEVFLFVMKVLATGISGDRVKDRIQIWTAIGSNEKSMTKTTLKSAYGGCYYEVNSGLFATRSFGSSSSATPDLALIHGKRICMQSECESTDKLRVALLKQCSGHDTISTRRLHKDCMSIICQALIIFLCNEIPGSDDSSGGFLRRLEIFFHGMCFVEDPKLPSERKENRRDLERIFIVENGKCNFPFYSYRIL
jgi:hypothetical protein